MSGPQIVGLVIALPFIVGGLVVLVGQIILICRPYRDGVWSDRKIDRALARHVDPKIAAEIERAYRDGAKR